MPDLVGGPRPRLLFCSYHCYLDPSSGAALATRDLLELLTRRGWPCQVFCGPQLDGDAGASPEQLLRGHGLAFEVRSPPAGQTPFALYHFVQAGVPGSIYHSPASTGSPAPGLAAATPFLALFERALDRFRPDLVLTYGGHWLTQDIIQRASHRGLPVVFALHNFAYTGSEVFRHVAAVLVPSQFARDHYQRALGLDCAAVPGPLNWERVSCPDVAGRYVTFVNPQPEKGVFVFARIAHELGRRRPDIPLLVVEGRGRAGWLDHTGLDLGRLNLHVMANTPDPRAFYRVSRLVLMPSLWLESFGRVVAEAFINGLPVLASRRGALPETLEQGGFLFDIPAQYTPESRQAPTADEVAPWIDTIVRLWDDDAAYQRERQRSRAAAEAWRPEILGPRFEDFFVGVLRRHSPGVPRTIG